MNVKEVYSQLLKLDESIQIEVKQGSEIGRSVMETICAFSNEPGIVEGYILLGISKDSNGSYYVSGVDDPDRIQMNIATQCSSVFNQPRFESSRQSNSFTTTIMLEAIDDATSILLAEMLSSDTAMKKSAKDIGSQRLNTKKLPRKLLIF